VSTFMAEMLETGAILRGASSRCGINPMPLSTPPPSTEWPDHVLAYTLCVEVQCTRGHDHAPGTTSAVLLGGSERSKNHLCV
jgi:hypothetical protein